MTEEQIITLVKEYFIEEWCEEDGNGWVEFSGKLSDFLKFASKLYYQGRYDGYGSGYDDGCFKATGGE